MKRKVAILGAGMVGRAIAIDLSTAYEVTSFDISQQNLDLITESNINKVRADLSVFPDYSHLFNEFGLIISAVPGFMGYQTLETLIRLKKDVADISFFPENALELDQLAKENEVTAIVDCGVAPGMSNLILGYYDTQLKIESFHCMVGGLPKKRTKPFEYKAPFSPIDVIEEYTRPARYKENGHIVIKPALSDAELIDIDHAGTLEAFNTDGLRSLLFTMPHIPDMKEKTLRYPGHIALIQSLQKAGFFNTEHLNIKGNLIRPIDMTSSLLFDQWKPEKNDIEFTVMKIIINGIDNNKPVSIEYLLYDETNIETGNSSMSRTTGYTCTAALNLIAEKKFSKKGVFPPELIGKDHDCFNYIIRYLEERKVYYRKRVYNPA